MMEGEVEVPEEKEIPKGEKPEEKKGFDNLGKGPAKPVELTQEQKDEKEAERLRKYLTKKGIKFHPKTGLVKLRAKKTENL